MAAGKRKSKKAKRRESALRLVVISATCLVVLGAVLWLVLRGSGPGAGDSGRPGFDEELKTLARQRGVDAASIIADDPIRKEDGVFVRTWRITFGDSAARDALITDLETTAAQHRGQVASVSAPQAGGEIRARVDFDVEAFDLHLVVKPQRVVSRANPTPAPTVTATPRPEPPSDARGRLAIILDDGGQSMDLVAAAAALPPEVSVSILPFLPHSVETAAEMHRSGHEVWLHLPMEPVGYPQSKPGPGAILVTMNESELRTTVHSALNSVPHVAGVNNHMGSKATASLRTMTWVMQELKSRGVAFVDSRTTVHTVAEDAARAQGVPVARRHVFLDNEREPEAVRKQLAEAVYRCRLDGEAIAIGHLAGVTVRVLEQELPKIAGRGADLVFPTKLTR